MRAVCSDITPHVCKTNNETKNEQEEDYTLINSSKGSF